MEIKILPFSAPPVRSVNIYLGLGDGTFEAPKNYAGAGPT